MKILMVANGEPPSSKLIRSLMQTHSHLIAVDGGLTTCLQYGLIPEMVIGDFDSTTEDLRAQYKDIKQIYTPDQSKTDLEKALKYLEGWETETITVCGALGRRIDHTLTNICLLSRYPGKVKFQSETELCFALPKTVKLKCEKGQTLSLIPISSQVSAVTTRGLKWELTHETLCKNNLSISNICLESEVFISFETGDLLVCQSQEIANELTKNSKTGKRS